MFFIRLLFFLTLKVNLIFLNTLYKKSSKNKKKYFSSYILNKLETLNLSILKNLNYRINILYNNKKNIGLYEVGDNIFLHAPNTNRFKKIIGKTNCVNQGEVIFNIIKKKNPTIIDIGSYIGEVSIYFAKKNAKAKVFSYEASKNNFIIQKENIDLNNLKNVQLYNKIVDEKANSYKYVSEYLGSENFVSKKKKKIFLN